MRAAVIVFPGSNCDRDMAVALRDAGADVSMVWHKDADLPANIDLVALPGGFSFGDYLRCGAIAARSAICTAIIAHAKRGGYVLGVCNGFQILTETGLLPGTLMRNAGLRFICRTLTLTVENTDSVFTTRFSQGQNIQLPIAHHDGNYFVDPDQHAALAENNQIALRYVDNPNGSVGDIAGVFSQNRRILGMMPHPERAISDQLGLTDGKAIFRGVLENVISAT